ncbi:CBS domain-containing protein [Sphingopyxis sp.]|uniref:CBS domain-containing protein n=1 Tax=Sphingopyxis sp. TaxID=1908224 RepID=UPI003D0A9E3F
MAESDARLKAVKTLLSDGETIEPTTIREFLWWFEMQRRTRQNVAAIDASLKKYGIRTVPNYLNRWVDTPMTFALATEEEAEGLEVSADGAVIGDQSVFSIENDPSFRVGNIHSATLKPLCVKPNEKITVAYTEMLVRNYSQLPVMTNDRELKGMISWKSVGARLATGVTGHEVKDFMDVPVEIGIASSLFDAIKIIVEHDYVLVRSEDKTISGIVTASDIAVQFSDISAPFLLISEIENNLRSLISAKISVQQIKKTCEEQYLPKNFKNIHDLTFGNCVKILDVPENWELLGLLMDRATFSGILTEVNKIRNDVMHFNPDPPDHKARRTLEEIGQTLKVMRQVGAFKA